MAETGPVAAIVVAAGSGRRFSAEGPPKQFVDLLGRPLVEWAVRAFLVHPAIDQVVLVLPAAYVASSARWFDPLGVSLVAGGEQRSDSVRNGLGAVDPKVRTVLIHDGARPFVSASLIDRILSETGNRGVVPGLRVTDTLKEVDAAGNVIRTVPRDGLWGVQTPQAFPMETLLEAHGRAKEECLEATDDAAIFERYGLPVRVVEGDRENIKVTTQADLAEAIVLAQRLPSFHRSRGESLK